MADSAIIFTKSESISTLFKKLILLDSLINSIVPDLILISLLYSDSNVIEKKNTPNINKNLFFN